MLSWQDRRARRLLLPLSAKRHAVHRRTGLFLSPHYGAAKLRWCLDHLAPVRRAARSGRLAWGPLASFLAFRLLAERPLLADPVNASRTLLWNLGTRDWDPALLDLFGLPAAPLPRCVGSRGPFGTLHAGARRIPLSLVTGDQPASLFAAGEVDLRAAHVNVGTGAFLQRPLRRPLRSPRLLTSVVLAGDRAAIFALEGTVNGAGSALVWAAGRLGVDPAQIEAELPGWLEEEQAPPLFLNGVSGLGAPYWVPGFRSRFLGRGEPAARLVAVVESIAFLLRANLDAMCRVLPPPRRLRLSGGLANLDGLGRRLADLTGLPVERAADPEATVRGLAWLLTGDPAQWRAEGAARRFQPAACPALHARYRRWRAAMSEAIAGAEL